MLWACLNGKEVFMHHILKKTVILVAVVALFGVPLSSHVFAQEQIEKEPPDGGTMVVDLVMVRPFSFLTFLAGFSAFCITAPVSAIAGNAGDAWEAMVVAPAKFTYTRPLGVY
jgi:hypothetical protein